MLSATISQHRRRDRRGAGFADAQVNAWIAATEAADGQALEAGVQTAMNQLVLDLKANSLWVPIETMVVKMGARTVAGALIDIKNPGTSWTNVGFIGADYNRTSGLKGNGTTKYLNTNRNNNAEPQNDQAMWDYITEIAAGDRGIIGCSHTGTGASSVAFTTTFQRMNLQSRNTTTSFSNTRLGLGLAGITRSSGTQLTIRGLQSDFTFSNNSSGVMDRNICNYSFLTVGGVAERLSDHRGCVAAVGKAHNLQLAETCVATFVASITSLGL